MPPSPLPKLRRLCLALPEATEVEAWGEPTFRVRGKLFAMYAAQGHHTAGRPAVWVKAASGNQPFMVAHAPHRFFVPPYVGPSGWVGVWLDDVADWEELRELLADAWRLTAPKRLAAQLPETLPDEAPVAKRTAKTATTKKAAAKKAPVKKAAPKQTKAKKPTVKKTAPKKSATKRTTKRTTKRATKRR